jgi:hypothetical protein
MTDTTKKPRKKPATRKPPPPGILSPEDVRQIGETIGSSTYWQADVAKEVGYSKSMMTRFLNGSRWATDLLALEFRRVIVERLAAMIEILGRPGMPDANSAETLEAQKHLAAGVAILRALNPAPRIEH